MPFIRKPKPDADSYEPKTSDSSTPVPRKALPGRTKSDKRAPIKRGESITSPHLIGKWSPR